MALAEDTDRLYSFRQSLEQTRQHCALFDTIRYVRNLETALTLAWKRHENRQLPDHIEVEDKDPIIPRRDDQLL